MQHKENEFTVPSNDKFALRHAEAILNVKCRKS